MIRLVSVIGHGVELIPHFINHYKEMVDKIFFVVYESDNNKGLTNKVKNIIKDYDNVSIVHTEYHRVFDWERVTELYNKIKNKHKNDWWVVADIDEFQLYDYPYLGHIINECESNGWELVRGGFIDRIGEDGEFCELTSEYIFKQFPYAGFFRYPLSNACPNKVCLMKGYIEVTPGQHYAKIDGHTTWRWQGWNHPLIAPINKWSVQVHHFKWDKTSIKRLKQVADNNEEYSYSKEYKKMYDELEKNDFRIDINDKNYMFERCEISHFSEYKQWNKLINKITSI
jgi:hypothetical protein